MFKCPSLERHTRREVKTEEELKEPLTTIHHMRDWFDHAFQGLAVTVPPADVLALAELVNQSMAGKARTYHTASHVLSLCEGMQPIQILAALFHDVVVYQLDGGFADWVVPSLADVTQTVSGDLFLREFAPGDWTVALCADIFGLYPGQALLLRSGMDEFLSAVVAVRLLQHLLSDVQLITLVACIELTIPFRAPDAYGTTAAQGLARRVKAYCATRPLHELVSEQQKAAFVKATMKDAVDFANQDLAGFTKAAPEYCLSNSMLLVEESMTPHAALQANSLRSYRTALLGMDNFLKQLNPTFVGHSYEGHPDVSAVMQMQATTQRNIAFVRDYLAAVLNSVALIEAVALSTGSESPLSLFLKCNHPAKAASDAWQDRFLAPAIHSLVEAKLYQVLSYGFRPDTHDGLDALPLTARVYGFMGREGTQKTLRMARQMFDGGSTPRAFLLCLDRDLISTIIGQLAETDVADKGALFSLKDDLYAIKMSTG